MAKYRKLGRTSNQRKALLRNQVTQLLYHGKIRTTEAKAKEIRKIAEGLIALGVKEKDNFEVVKVQAKVAKKDAEGKRVKEVVDGKKVTVYETVEKEIKKDFKVWNIGSKLNGGGIPVTFMDGKYYYSDSFDHTLIIGSTGSGKTIRNILPMVFNLGYAGESMVINDTKGEIYSNTATFLKKQGYTIKIINLRDAFAYVLGKISNISFNCIVLCNN
jgi:ribosomal protein L17